MSEIPQVIIDPQVDVAERVAVLIQDVAEASELKEVKNSLEQDPEARLWLGSQLEDYKTAFHNRIADLYEQGQVNSQTATGWLLLAGAHEYSPELKTRLLQREVTARTRHQLEEDYIRCVPSGHRSLIFSNLIGAKSPSGRRAFTPDSDTFVAGTALSIVTGGINGRSPILTNPALRAKAGSDPAARALILAESGRMVDYYYPTTE